MELVKPLPQNGGALITEHEAKLTLEDIQTIKNAIFKGCEEGELKLFLHDCQRQGVHPLDRLIHPTVRKDKQGNRTYTPITSIDLFRARAEDTGKYAGNDDPVFSGKVKGEDYKASVTVYKIVDGIRCAFTATARWVEYKPDSTNGKDFMWQSKPHVMLGKCAEALALRKAFPRTLGRLYIKEEMEQAGNKEPLVTIDTDDDRVPPEVTSKTITKLAPVPSQIEAGTPPAPEEPPAESDGNPDKVDVIVRNTAANGRGVCITLCDPQGVPISDEQIWWNTFHKGAFDRLKEAKGQHVLIRISNTEKNGKVWTNIEEVCG